MFKEHARKLHILSLFFLQGKVAGIGLNSRLAVTLLLLDFLKNNLSKVSVGSDRSVRIVVLSTGSVHHYHYVIG